MPQPGSYHTVDTGLTEDIPHAVLKDIAHYLREKGLMPNSAAEQAAQLARMPAKQIRRPPAGAKSPDPLMFVTWIAFGAKGDGGFATHNFHKVDMRCALFLRNNLVFVGEHCGRVSLPTETLKFLVATWRWAHDDATTSAILTWLAEGKLAATRLGSGLLLHTLLDGDGVLLQMGCCSCTDSMRQARAKIFQIFNFPAGHNGSQSHFSAWA